MQAHSNPAQWLSNQNLEKTKQKSAVLWQLINLFWFICYIFVKQACTNSVYWLMDQCLLRDWDILMFIKYLCRVWLFSVLKAVLYEKNDLQLFFKIDCFVVVDCLNLTQMKRKFD